MEYDRGNILVMKNILPMIIFTIYTHVCISLILTKLMGFVKKNLKINEHTNVTLRATLNDVLNLTVIFIICSLNDCISRLFLCIQIATLLWLT